MASGFSIGEIQRVLDSKMDCRSKLEEIKSMMRCDVCAMSCLNVSNFCSHLNGKKHIRNLKRKNKQSGGIDPSIIESQILNTQRVTSSLQDLLRSLELNSLKKMKLCQYLQQIETLKEENSKLKVEAMKLKIKIINHELKFGRVLSKGDSDGTPAVHSWKDVDKNVVHAAIAMTVKLIFKEITQIGDITNCQKLMRIKRYRRELHREIARKLPSEVPELIALKNHKIWCKLCDCALDSPSGILDHLGKNTFATCRG